MINELGLPHVARHDGTNRAGQFHVGLRKRRGLALHNDGTERSVFSQNRHREKGRKALFAEASEMLVSCMRLGQLRRNRTHVFYSLTRDALSDGEAHLADGLGGKANVAAHDELVAVAFDEINRANLRTK